MSDYADDFLASDPLAESLAIVRLMTGVIAYWAALVLIALATHGARIWVIAENSPPTP